MTFDRKNRQKKGWKAFQADYDYVFGLSDRGCTYCLDHQQIAALLAMTEYLKWPTRWVSAADDIDAAAVLTFAENLERALMSGCCDDNLPIQYRYGDDGILERSLNGGGTWVDVPEYDVRNTSITFPPLPEPDADNRKCDGAASVAAMFEAQIGDQLTDDMSRQDIFELIEEWVKTMHETSNPFIALVTVAANQIFALVISAVRAALTEAVYDQLKCIVLENISENADFTPATAEATRTQVQGEITGIAGLFLQHLIYLLGSAGMTNAARSGFVVGADCADCADFPTVWWINSMDVETIIYPDEDGFYEVSTGPTSLYAPFFGAVWFNDPPAGNESPYPNAWRLTDVTYPTGTSVNLAGLINPVNGNYETPPPVSYCYAAVQNYSDVGAWSMRFKIMNPCP